MQIFKLFSTFLFSTPEINLSNIEIPPKNFWERLELNPGLLSENQVWYIRATRSPLAKISLKLSSGYCYLIPAWINQPWILEHFLRLAKNDSVVRRQDFFTCLTYANRNPIGNWKFPKLEPCILLFKLTLRRHLKTSELNSIRAPWQYICPFLVLLS